MGMSASSSLSFMHTCMSEIYLGRCWWLARTKVCLLLIISCSVARKRVKNEEEEGGGDVTIQHRSARFILHFSPHFPFMHHPSSPSLPCILLSSSKMINHACVKAYMHPPSLPFFLSFFNMIDNYLPFLPILPDIHFYITVSLTT